MCLGVQIPTHILSTFPVWASCPKGEQLYYSARLRNAEKTSKQMINSNGAETCGILFPWLGATTAACGQENSCHHSNIRCMMLFFSECYISDMMSFLLIKSA